ncbi:putative cytochrome bd ubiquinol oxidase subunit I [Actinoplanes missouriensis 431]|uniref:Putative cytochrome bd ubiquinol oxidase subunit I n=1 Tax=Actinoplanes missouriensis (strain ATCC 14538 / DSM 43046 / CBS 188.64 / JCM 3121 / NBRC 102363 / NCIMB 12654 / NRRL B-3342 / UNCC 431) TaxID=512565 RepID=I0HAX9_ACTM4|nr:cytochrome ubiquinol oxidase subunit I [Actinoplanes missouriensis]BAL90166.1 putative cytochrome bd ubiquinol oxidase subunit I [Actinoplanes missouriensis 431]
MDALDLSRWQFGITTVYHFIFVPLTIGLSALVAGLQTAWVRTGKEHYLRATKFWGKLFLINFAIGVVTGIVQEFQFGMNWSAYSRFVGDIFGAPLAIEGLLAFFLESTFLGLWIFGWDRLPKKIHLASIWMVALGTTLSAYFILAANSWMQHPVGWTMGDGRAELTSIGAVLTNSTTLVTFPHTITACFLTGGAMLLAVSAWHLRRNNQPEVFKPSMRLGAWVVLIAGLGVLITGDIQARVMTEQQPMKMAAAEALYETTGSASFSLFTIGSLDGDEELYSVRIPSLLSFMATGSPDGEVEGINNVQSEYEQAYGPGDYRPIVPVTYWSFRLMIGFGGLAMLIAAAALWFTRGDRRPRSRWLWIAAVSTVAMPLLANSFGWIFTEMGRQPWTVFGLFTTAESGSPSVSAGEAATGLIVLTVLYGVLAVIEFGLFLKYAKAGAPEIPAPTTDEADKPLAFAY